jgi:PAS domain S-box-containing protein
VNVLVVDDVAINRRLLRALLEAESVQVCEACDGIEALDVLAREKVDLVISDILMPRMDGYRLCHEIRRSPRFKDLPVLIYSATYTSPADEKLSLDIGADMFLSKPASSATVLAAVRQLTAASRVHPARQPKPISEVGVMKEYSEQLVAKLAEKNSELATQAQVLRQSESRLRALIQTEPAGVLVVSRAGRLLEANPAGMAMLRSDGAGRVIGQSFASIAAPSQQAALNRMHQEIMHGGDATLEFESMGFAGATQWLEVHAAPLRDERGEVWAMLAIAHDVTRRKQAEDDLRASEEKYRLLFQNSMDAIIQATPDGKELRANAAACAMFRLDESELRARGSLGLMDFSDGRSSALLRRLASEGRVTGVVPVIRGDGTVFECEVSAARYASRDQVVRTTVVLRDITQRLEAQRLQRALEARLSEASKMEAIGQMAAGVAHDFNNIISAILGNVSLASRASASEASMRLALAEIDKAGLRARNMVKQLLAFARELPQERLCVSLGPVLREHADLLRASLPPNVELTLRLPPQPLFVLADATQVGEVVMNLCTNAAHATSAEGGLVSLSLEAADLPPEAIGPFVSPPQGRYARIQVSDNGQGMDQGVKARIFEPFFTTKGRGEGTGLGLSMVLGIVEAHQGAVCVQSAPGQGATFDVYLPLTQPPPAMVVAPSEPAAPGAVPPNGGGKHLAYVDDYEAMVFLVTRAMEDFGYRVSGFERAQDLLATVRADPAAFDVVITDYNMPGTSGLELTRTLKALRPDLPVLVTSGFVSEPLQLAAREAGASEVIYKSNSLEEMCESIRRALDAHS